MSVIGVRGLATSTGSSPPWREAASVRTASPVVSPCASEEAHDPDDARRDRLLRGRACVPWRLGLHHPGPCTPNDTDLGSSGPTSFDCPPDAGFVNSIAIPYTLTTGTTSKTAVSGAELNIFCGFCRDPIGGVFFREPPTP